MLKNSSKINDSNKLFFAKICLYIISFCFSFFRPKLKKVFFFGFFETELMSEATEAESSDWPPLASFRFHISSLKIWLPDRAGSRGTRLTREGVELADDVKIRGGFSITALTSTGSSGFVTSMVGLCVTSLELSVSFFVISLELSSCLIWLLMTSFELLMTSWELLTEIPDWLEEEEDGSDGGGEVGGAWNSAPICLKSWNEKKNENFILFSIKKQTNITNVSGSIKNWTSMKKVSLLFWSQYWSSSWRKIFAQNFLPKSKCLVQVSHFNFLKANPILGICWI